MKLQSTYFEEHLRTAASQNLSPYPPQENKKKKNAIQSFYLSNALWQSWKTIPTFLIFLEENNKYIADWKIIT